MAANTINGTIGDMVDALNTLRNSSRDPVLQQKVQTLLTEVYFPIWQEIIKQQLDASLPAYQDADAKLQVAVKSVNDALKSATGVQQAIADAVTAAKAVDQIAGIVLPVLALL